MNSFTPASLLPSRPGWSEALAVEVGRHSAPGTSLHRRASWAVQGIHSITCISPLCARTCSIHGPGDHTGVCWPLLHVHCMLKLWEALQAWEGHTGRVPHIDEAHEDHLERKGLQQPAPSDSALGVLLSIPGCIAPSSGRCNNMRAVCRTTARHALGSMASMACIPPPCQTAPCCIILSLHMAQQPQCGIALEWKTDWKVQCKNALLLQGPLVFSGTPCSSKST